MVSGGAKEVLSAWLLQPQPGGSGGGGGGGDAGGYTMNGRQSAVRWSHRWLATRPPPAGGLRRKSTLQASAKLGSFRQAVSIFSPAMRPPPTGGLRRKSTPQVGNGFGNMLETTRMM